LPASQRLIRHPYDLYDLLHGVVIAWFAETRGIELELRGTSRRAARDPALCFLREDSHDVCLRGVKILGSAQRRRRGALLQHGSLVLRRSEFAPHVAGLCDLAPGCELVPEDGAALALRLGQALGQQVSVGALGDDEQRRAGELVAASAGTGLGPQRPN